MEKAMYFKIWSVVLILSTVVSLVACGGGSVEDPRVSRIKDSSLLSVLQGVLLFFQHCILRYICSRYCGNIDRFKSKMRIY